MVDDCNKSVISKDVKNSTRFSKHSSYMMMSPKLGSDSTKVAPPAQFAYPISIPSIKVDGQGNFIDEDLLKKEPEPSNQVTDMIETETKKTGSSEKDCFTAKVLIMKK